MKNALIVASLALLGSTHLLGCGGGGKAATTIPPTTVTTTTVTTVTYTTTKTGETPDDHPANPWCSKTSSTLTAKAKVTSGKIPYTPTGPVEGEGEWCAIQGPAPDWNLTDYCPKNNGPKAQIKIMTYNLQWWNNYQQYPNHKPHDDTLNPAIPANIVKYDKDVPFDIMGFQECEVTQVVIDAAKKDGLQGDWEVHEYWDQQYDGSSIDIGLAFKKQTFDFIDYGQGNVAEDAPPGVNYYGKRGAQWLRLKHKATGQPVFILNHHGPTAVGAGGLCKNKGTAYQILKMVADNAEVGDQIFIIGDFNGPSIQEVAGRWQYAEEIGTIACYINHIYTVSNIQTVWGIDNFFANCAKPVTKTMMDKGGSDHWAFNVVYEWGGDGAEEVVV